MARVVSSAKCACRRRPRASWNHGDARHVRLPIVEFVRPSSTILAAAMLGRRVLVRRRNVFSDRVAARTGFAIRLRAMKSHASSHWASTSATPRVGFLNYSGIGAKTSFACICVNTRSVPKVCCHVFVATGAGVVTEACSDDFGTRKHPGRCLVELPAFVRVRPSLTSTQPPQRPSGRCATSRPRWPAPRGRAPPSSSHPRHSRRGKGLPARGKSVPLLSGRKTAAINE